MAGISVRRGRVKACSRSISILFKEKGTDMDADTQLTQIVARTPTEESLDQLLDHMDEWGIESEIRFESLGGAWVVTLTTEVEDPRRQPFFAYLTERSETWTVESAGQGGPS